MAEAHVPAWMRELQQLESAIEVQRVVGQHTTDTSPATVTVWVGGIPQALARDESALYQLLGEHGGELQKLTARVKALPYKSWCLATFLSLDALERLTKRPLVVGLEPGDMREAGSEPPSLIIRGEDVQGELAKASAADGAEAGAVAGALSAQASKHEAKGARPKTMKKPKRKKRGAKDGADESCLEPEPEPQLEWKPMPSAEEGVPPL